MSDRPKPRSASTERERERERSRAAAILPPGGAARIATSSSNSLILEIGPPSKKTIHIY